MTIETSSRTSLLGRQHEQAIRGPRVRRALALDQRRRCAARWRTELLGRQQLTQQRIGLVGWIIQSLERRIIEPFERRIRLELRLGWVESFDLEW